MASLSRRATLIAVSAAFVACVLPITVGPAAAKPMPAAPPVTPSGWSITPAGKSITADSGPGLAGPWGVAVAPDGVHAMVTSSGQAAQIESVEVFDVNALKRTDMEAYDGATGASVSTASFTRPMASARGRPVAASRSSTPTTWRATAA